jgi:hypothetical protein
LHVLVPGASRDCPPATGALRASSAQLRGGQVQVKIEFKNPPVPVHTYFFYVHPRDAENPQFEWAFQRQLYDCMHDYFVEMFTRTPYNLELPPEGNED